jgi:DNA-binding response OmpR family regulator
LTANDSHEFEVKCLQSGMDYFTTKPLQVDFLCNKIEMRLNLEKHW